LHDINQARRRGIVRVGEHGLREHGAATPILWLSRYAFETWTDKVEVGESTMNAAGERDTRRSFHDELEALKKELAEMASIVDANIVRGTQAFLDGNLQALEDVIRRDAAVDELSTSIENRVYQILATQQPMASDLRFLVSLLRINHEVERTGDLMVNVAKAGQQIYPHEILPRLRGILSKMGRHTHTMFQQAIESFVNMDISKAAALEQMDDVIDDFQRDLLKELVAGSGEEETEVAVRVALVARFYERMADHAVNIGERVRFMVTGELASVHPESLQASPEQ
jgi:phosphate transport system protein